MRTLQRFRAPLLLALFLAALPGLLAAQVTFRLGNTTVAPGEVNAVTPFAILVDEGAPPVEGWTFAVRYDPAVFRKVTIESNMLMESFTFRRETTFADPGIVGAALVFYANALDCALPPLVTSDTDGMVGILRLCVREDAAPGLSPLELVPEARGSAEYPNLTMTYTSGAQTFVPAAQGGIVTVAGDPISGRDCRPDPEDVSDAEYYCPPPPEGVEGTIRLEADAAEPGDSVTVPFIVFTSAQLQGFSFGLDFDEEVLEVTDVERIFQKPDGSDWDFQVLKINNSSETPGNWGADEGFIAGAYIFEQNEPAGPENSPIPGSDTELLALHFKVKPDAPMGETYLRFVDGARTHPVSPPVANILVVTHVTAYPRYDLSPITVNGVLRIVPDISIFIRGDSNGDKKVELTDALSTLGYLFLGGRPPRCLDAADANDDGTLNISDPVATLTYLFLGGHPLPSPTDSPQVDPTADLLDCARGTP